MLDFWFFFESILLGIGLAMDAFSVSLANGLNEPCMSNKKALGISGMFAFFQALMPLIGWILVHTIVQKFKALEAFIPWIALALLGYIGGKMLYDGIKGKDEEAECKPLALSLLIAQGIATSIDALSVGFTIAEYTFIPALICALIIATVTIGICFVGVKIGVHVGKKFSHKASILGGAILIFIGLEIFISSFF
ncbi:MAG: manganese efflux pump [Ruminococcaceae bacterium]|nr:manganese efflux pump [Oscillospiraceae bacterium]